MQKFPARKFHFEPPFTSFDHLVGEQLDRVGHLDAERSAPPPKSVMNSRRLMGSPRFEDHTLPHHYRNAASCITAKLIVEWQRWVIGDRRYAARVAASPLHRQ